MFTKLQNISFIAFTGLAACFVGIVLFLFWLASQSEPGFNHYAPAFLALLFFCCAIYRAVFVLEDFWQIKRSRIDKRDPFFAYTGIFIWCLFMNALIIAFAYVKTKDAGFVQVIENFYNRGNDIPHYIDIAKQWYTNDSTDHQFDIVFFPLFPMLVRMIAPLVRNYTLSCMVVSNVFAVLTGVMFYKLSLLLSGPQSDEPLNATKFLYIFPSAYFFFVPMTESLFVFLSVACLYYAIKKDYFLTFVFGLCVSLTRVQGVLLIIPVACELIREMRNDHLNNAFLARCATKNCVCLLSFPIGLFIYLMINYFVYDNAFIFLQFQQIHWYQRLSYFWNTPVYLLDYFKGWLNTGDIEHVMALSVPNIVAFWGTLLLIAYGAKKIRPSLTLYAMAYFIVSFGSTWLLSGMRYAACLFPLAFCAAKLVTGHRAVNIALTTLYIVLFAAYLNLFLTSFSVY